jgi:AraC family transcriptional regulator, transcriptional activator of pobA
MPPYINATHDEMKEYMRLLGKIKYELMNPVSDTYNIIVSLLYYLLLIINRTYAAAYCLPAEIAKNNFAFRFKDLLEQNIRTHQRVQEYADMLHVSRITLNNSVKAQFGVSATHLIKQRLLEELKNELLFSNRTVSEMADDFNFSDPSHLMRFFKQQTGKTFTQYMPDTSANSAAWLTISTSLRVRQTPEASTMNGGTARWQWQGFMNL